MNPSLALSAVLWLAISSAVFCALTAYFCWQAYTAAKKVRSIVSMQGELAEIRDYMGKIDRWAKRINAREVMQEHRDPTTGKRLPSSTSVSSIAAHDKDELRRRAGLVAGQPARHGS